MLPNLRRKNSGHWLLCGFHRAPVSQFGGDTNFTKRPENRTGDAPDLPRPDGAPVWPIRRPGDPRGANLREFRDLTKRPENRTGDAPDLPRPEGALFGRADAVGASGGRI